MNLVVMLFGSTPSDLWVASGAQSTGEFTTDVELDVSVAHQERLRVGIDSDELDAFEASFDHAIDRVDTTAASSDDFDDSEIVLRWNHGEAS